jgi:hypothetical protein
MDPVTIIVGPRDRFSVTDRWLDNLFATTPGAGDLHPVICVLGAAPPHLTARWQLRFGDRVTFVLRSEFLNQPEVRNIGLGMATTRLAVVSDNDCYPRAGWLDALVSCQEETGAVMVSPLILERPDRIHCAGTDLYKNVVGGRELAHKYLRYHGYPYADGCNIQRSRIDYGELHLELVEVAPTLELGAFDERIPEVGEVDSGLTWAAGGREMWFEPAAVVHFDLNGPLEADDVEFFAWRWDLESIRKGYEVFEDKWGFDMTEEGGFHRFVVDYNATVGRLARLHPSAATVRWGRFAKKTSDRFAYGPRAARDVVRHALHGSRSTRIEPTR